MKSVKNIHIPKNEIIKGLDSHEKVSKPFYKLILSKCKAAPVKVMNRWETILGHPLEMNMWNNIFITPFKNIDDNYLQFLPFEINHRIFAKNSYLILKM